MELILYPNNILTTKTESVAEFNQELFDNLDKMLIVMHKHDGMGLSANQVGISKSFFIMKDSKGKIWEFINPKIINQEDLQCALKEGCLSTPGIRIEVPRYNNVTVEAMNRNGEVFKVVCEAMEAICIQHEIDHLNGIFFLDKLNRQQRRAILRELK